jgi:ubiquinone/menaquinone biosynthesis C-methylase UbiE
VVVNFDAVAPFYRRLERLIFGEKLQRARCAFVRQIPPARRALVVGDGDGRFLEQLRRAQPELPIDCLDASARMLALARARVGDDNVQYIRADIRVAAFPARRYDLIVTNFFLDCFDERELPRVTETLAAAAGDDATWLVAHFQVPSRGWRRPVARLLIATMYLFFRLVAGLTTRRLVEYAPLLEAQGFCLTNSAFSPNELLRAQVWRRQTARPA